MGKHTHEEEPVEQKAETEPENVQPDNAENAGNSAAEEKTDADKIADLQALLAEANDQFLRKAADFENYRKRMIREKQEAVDYANQSLLLDLIEIKDDFERAIKAAEACCNSDDQSVSPVFKTFYEGVIMIEKRFSSLLDNKWGLKRFDSEGQPFDHNRHEAIMMEKSSEVTEPVVKEEFYKGYTLKDRVVRSAKVKVLMPDAGMAPADNAENASANQE